MKTGKSKMQNNDDIKIKLKNSISFKLAVILLLIILIQVPLSYVRGLIDERQQMQFQAQNKISQQWGGQQYIGSPVLMVYNNETKMLNSHNKQASTIVQTSQLIQAQTWDVSIQLDATKRYLGIYEAAIYESQVKMSGTIELNQELINKENHLKLFLPIKEIRGLKNLTKITVNNTEITHPPQQRLLTNTSGIEIDISEVSQAALLSFEIEYKIVGSNQLDILPLAKETHVRVQSNWPAPSFIGDYLPDQRTITENGFSAKWQVNKIVQSVNNKQNSLSKHVKSQIKSSSFGVKILIPANIYQVNERTVKYSFLIVLLTFAGFFLAELFFKLRLHPFQYLLIGCSLSVFYLLLLSLSEYIKFNWAFLISASSIIVLIGSYCSVVLQQRKRGIYTAVMFAILYGFIFILVKAEETSLLMGAIGIWLILAMIMYLTRKIDWYAVSIDDQK
ncbi:MAG: cell envelope integrity protein CreD [Marinicellaceae bacterium]